LPDVKTIYLSEFQLGYRICFDIILPLQAPDFCTNLKPYSFLTLLQSYSELASAGGVF
jgi:hypothetical protein